MSILNISISPARALVGVDTQGVDERGCFVTVSKMLALPHINAVIAGRGVVLFTGAAAAVVASTPCADVIDAAHVLPPLLNKVYADFVAGLRARGQREFVPFAQQTIALVGYSPKAQRVKCFVHEQETEARGFELTGVDVDAYMAPWDEGVMGVAPRPQNSGEMGAAAVEQARFSNRVAPEAACGGTLVVARITRFGTTIEPACELPGRKERSP